MTCTVQCSTCISTSTFYFYDFIKTFLYRVPCFVRIGSTMFHCHTEILLMAYKQEACLYTLDSTDIISFVCVCVNVCLCFQALMGSQLYKIQQSLFHELKKVSHTRYS